MRRLAALLPAVLLASACSAAPSSPDEKQTPMAAGSTLPPSEVLQLTEAVRELEVKDATCGYDREKCKL